MVNGEKRSLVVICFHFSNFALLETALQSGIDGRLCCDLLSF